MPEIPELKTYAELQKRTAFLSRFRYLSLGGQLGAATFGFDRHLNQAFYGSKLWKDVRDEVIIRDDGCDMGLPHHAIHFGDEKQLPRPFIERRPGDTDLW